MINLTDQKGLRELEALCIQEEAPACQATCPLHVDVRGMLGALDGAATPEALAAARAIYTKTAPFPNILSRVCDEPCRAACRRGEAGDPVAIRALEQAIMLPDLPPAPFRRSPQRERRVAVVGGGLSGLTAAFDLARKGYDLTLFEARDRLGGQVWELPEERLPRELIARDLEILPQLGVTIRLETVVSPVLLGELCESYDAVYLATGVAELAVDTLTYATDRPGLFAGGSLLRRAWSPVTSMSDGRRAAISIDRYLQNVSLTASRFREGAYETALYVNLAGIEPLPAVPPPAGAPDRQPERVMAWAAAEAARCLQCHCLECVKVCEYLAEYGSYPRSYLRTIYNNLSIVMGERHANQFINSCATCGLCAAVCPTSLDMGAVCKQARAVMVEQKRMPPSAHDFALRDMAFSNSDKFALARNWPGSETSDYLFFPGCQLAGSSPEQVTAVYDYLQGRLPGDVGLMLGCCGAPADWAGRNDLRDDALAQFEREFEALGRPKVILACSSCYQLFKARLPEVELVSLWTVLQEQGLPETATIGAEELIAIHDPCTTRGESAVQDSVRDLVGRLGYDVSELARSRERTTCCGFGGLMVYANRRLAKKVVQQRISESLADYITYCAVCRDFLAAQGKPTRHLLDLIFGGGHLNGGPGPGFSQKHENRARLKRQLLWERWGESLNGQEDYEKIRLELSDALLAAMEERLILVADVQQVIAHAERSGAKLLNPENGHYLAHFRPHTVTYWVEYTPKEDAFVVFNAYSHRMELGEGKRR